MTADYCNEAEVRVSVRLMGEFDKEVATNHSLLDE